MLFFKFFQKTRETQSEVAEFVYFFTDFQHYLKINYGTSKNVLIIHFLKLVDWCWKWQVNQTKDYFQLLTDYIFWESRDYYRDNLEKFVAGELNGVQIVNGVLYPLLSNIREAQDFTENFKGQQKIELDPKSFQFSKIITELQFPLEAFDDEPEEDDYGFLTEEELREIMKVVLKDMEKYFKN